jgi:transcriptional regulator with XRE-family HTH domain
MEFGHKLKDLREDKQLLQKQVAKLVNVTPSRISEWENSKLRPVYEDLVKLALLFDVKTDYLLGLEDIDGNRLLEFKAQKNN